jgi:hypothetical protein
LAERLSAAIGGYSRKASSITAFGHHQPIDQPILGAGEFALGLVAHALAPFVAL